MAELLTAEEFTSEVWRWGRNEGPGMLWDAWPDRLAPGALAGSIADVWSGAEFPELFLRPRWAWLMLFRAAGFTVDGQPAARPAEPMRLYRGAPPRRARRMSWTTDRDKAEWFARRFEFLGPAFVYETDCPPDAMLMIPGSAGRPDEHEVVINPAGLTIRRAER